MRPASSIRPRSGSILTAKDASAEAAKFTGTKKKTMAKKIAMNAPRMAAEMLRPPVDMASTMLKPVTVANREGR